ncbi:methyl-accepting chemotaxis protein [Paenibacillus ginsengarvi]|uniref:PAS domain S-box protein n=1 Tax=Paenibacillus ginsengarvi TaxID=400777 RepID=A0A3B0BUC8_9BACL|nr:methyl-accepting chemotaxis protein [Paenibacillus ginsengarvi]RKN75819.1 PAS domain S-box protein [Paenibacillus ginsengarvi]
MNNAASEKPQALKASAVLNAIELSLAMIQFNTQGDVLWANDLFAKAMGYRASEMPGMHHRQFCTPVFAASAEYEQLWDNLRKGTKFQEKIVRVSRNGDFLWLEATYMPVFDEDERVTGVLKVATDITAREKAAAAMTTELQRMAEQLFGRAVEGTDRSLQAAAAYENIVRDNRKSLERLQELEHHTKNIRRIVQLIREFASQTDLLALNAAIEAAHAGQFARGFNVIAAEVKRLAQSVHAATKDIQDTTENISRHVHLISSGTKEAQNIIENSRDTIRLVVDEFAGIREAADRLEEQANHLSRML